MRVVILSCFGEVPWPQDVTWAAMPCEQPQVGAARYGVQHGLGRTWAGSALDSSPSQPSFYI